MWLSPGLILLLYNIDEERKGKVRANEEEEHIMAMVWSGLEKHEVNGCI